MILYFTIACVITNVMLFWNGCICQPLSPFCSPVVPWTLRVLNVLYGTSCTLWFQEQLRHVVISIDHLWGVLLWSPADQYKTQINCNLQTASLRSRRACRSQESWPRSPAIHSYFPLQGFLSWSAGANGPSHYGDRRWKWEQNEAHYHAGVTNIPLQTSPHTLDTRTPDARTHESYTCTP